jgi:eukaryotic-like serine/threonine-protein kinase
MIFKHLFSKKLQSEEISSEKVEQLTSFKPGDRIHNRSCIKQSLVAQTLAGCGETYLAIDLDLPSHPQVAIKYLKLPTKDRKIVKEAQILFNQETDNLSKLSLQTDVIPRLYDRFEEEGEFYVVKEYIEGRTLTQVLDNVQLSEIETVKLIKEILTALQELHSCNVIHRRITPDNIIRRSSNGNLVFSYYGHITEIRCMEPPITIFNGNFSNISFVFSDRYVAPEVWAKRPIFSSDIYSIGVIGIQSLIGCSMHDLQECPATGAIKWREFCQVSDRFADILNNMCEPSPRYRYNNVAEVLEAIEILYS